MKRFLLIMMFAVLYIPVSAAEADLISIGNFSAVEGTTSFNIPVLISGGGNIAAVTLSFSVGDGGPVLGGTETVTVTAVDFTTGTIWSSPSTNIIPPLPSQSATRAGTLQFTNATASGTLMTFTVNLSTATAGEVLLLNPNASNATTAADSTAQPLPLTFSSGNLTITASPEPSSSVLLTIVSLGFMGFSWRRRRSAAAYHAAGDGPQSSEHCTHCE